MAWLARTSLELDDVQRRALQAAMKVALTFSAASVFGACGGSMATDGPRAPADDSGTDATSAEVATVTLDSGADTTRPVPDAIVTATSCGPIAPDAATPEQTKCCAASVAAAFSPTWMESDETLGETHPELVECCNEIVQAYDGSETLGLTFQQARACCYVLPAPWYSHGGVACTPWGPPMPPAMPSSSNRGDDEAEWLS